MEIFIGWLIKIASVLGILTIVGLPIWIYEWRDKKKKFKIAFGGREPISDQAFYESYFQSLNIPSSVVIKVRRILEEVLDDDLSCLSAEDDLTKNLSFFFVYDSWAGIELVERLEEEFNIDITDEEASKAHTVKDIVSLVWSRLKDAEKRFLA